MFNVIVLNEIDIIITKSNVGCKLLSFWHWKLWWPVKNKMSFRNVHQVEDVWRMRLAIGTLTATKEGWLSCSFFSWSPGLIIIIIVILIIIINQCHSHIPCLANILILLLFMFCKSTINITITFHSIKGTRQFQSSIPSFCPKKAISIQQIQKDNFRVANLGNAQNAPSIQTAQGQG